jgi:hypothetical protein
MPLAEGNVIPCSVSRSATCCGQCLSSPLVIGWMVHVRIEIAKRDTTDLLRQQYLEQNLSLLQSVVQRLEELEARQSKAEN